MRTTSDMASDLPKVSDLPHVSSRGCVCPQSLPCPEFLILPPKSSCPCSCTDHRPLSTPYKPLPSHPSFLRAQESRSLPGLPQPWNPCLSTYQTSLSFNFPIRKMGPVARVGVKDSVSWVSSSPVAHAQHVAGAIGVPGNSLVQARHLSHPTLPQPGPPCPTHRGWPPPRRRAGSRWSRGR